MSKCRKCGKEINLKEMVCAYCGTPAGRKPTRFVTEAVILALFFFIIFYLLGEMFKPAPDSVQFYSVTAAGEFRPSISADSIDKNLLSDITEAIEKGADVNSRERGGRDTPTVLMYAAERNAVEAGRLLIEKGADLEAKAGGQRTALTAAVRAGSKDMAMLLIEKGADITARDYAGQTVLMMAIQAGFPEVVELLIARGADLEAKDASGRTVLERAAMTASVDSMKLILTKGVGAGQINEALFWAADHNSLEVAKILIDHEADVNAKHPRHGRTALEIAEEHSYDEMVSLLRKSCTP